MNERIKEIMGKTLDDKFSHTWDTMTHEGLLQFSEKFAELIVRECGVALSPMLRDMVSRGQAHDLIKKHFGVTE
jgi:hypothetical protein